MMRNDRKKKSRKKALKIWGIIIGVCLLLAGSITWLYVKATDVKHVDINKSDKALGIKTTPKPVTIKKPVKQPEAERKDIVNIAFFGVDRRSMGERGRSDSIMIATLDYKHKKVKLTSLMRDLYVPIEGHGQTKLNHAYAYGGAELAIKTINQNFGLNIRDYVTVDFFTLEKIIDQIGGVEIDVKPREVPFVNKYMVETAKIEKKPIAKLTKSGVQNLNGMQAVSYARIRKLGNGDFERTERQRTVLTAMMNKVKGEGAPAIPQLLLQIAPLIETSLNRADITSLAYDYFKQQPMKMEQARFPEDNKWSSEKISGIWYMTTDLSQMESELNAYLLKDQT